MKNKFLILCLATILVFTLTLTGCGSKEKPKSTSIKAGFICLHDENSTYDLNFINSAKEACEKLGIEYIIKTNIPEILEVNDADNHFQ